MGKFKESFLNELEERDLKYEEAENSVRLTFSTDGDPSEITVYIFFDEGDDICGVTLQAIVCRFREDKLAQGLVVSNSCNAQFRDAKFYIDKDYDVICDIDSFIDESTGNDEVLANLNTMLKVIEQAYPLYMKALWAN